MPTEDARIERIGDALTAADPQRTLRLPWRDRTEVFPVVDLPLDIVLLNHRSHRIKAHIESSDHRQVISDEPFSDSAQQAIADVIRSLDGFDELRDNLAEVGQQDDGVITRTGLLVNANRRAVALRDAVKDFIQVAVLPSDASNVEIDQLELRLQMKRDFREKYTFTNELLFVHDLFVEHNYTTVRIARDLNWATSEKQPELDRGKARVERSIRMLHYIREIQQRSENTIRLTFFDDKQQSLLELDEHLEGVGDTDEISRSEIYDMRMIGMLLELGYKPLRQMDAYFMNDYLYELLSEDEYLGVATDFLTAQESDTLIEIPGLDIVDPQDADGRRSAGPLLDFVLESFRDGRSSIPGTDFLIEKDALPGRLGPIISDAAEAARIDRRDEDNVLAPIKYIRTARQKIRKSQETYDRVQHLDGIDHGKLTYELRKLKSQADEFLGAIDT